MNWLAEGPSDLSAWIANGRGQLTSIEASGDRWPVSLGRPDQGEAASWLTSLASAMFGTPRDEIARSPDLGVAGVMLKCGLGLAEKLALAAGASAAAIVNNSLLSVSPVGPSQLDGLGAAVAAATRTWPERIVVARGIIADLAAVRRMASGLGGFAFPNRVSYAFDYTTGREPDKINAVRDAALLRKAGLEVVDHDSFTSADLREAHAQYTAVYIGRHGGRNPRFTQAFFDAAHGRRAAQFWGLRSGSELAAFVALRDHGDFLSVPLIGYRTDADKRAGLYRQIFALALQIAAERKAVINFGAGAAHYKKLRGAASAVEYFIIVPSRTTWLSRGLGSVLGASEQGLNRLVPRAIAAHGG